MDTQNTQKVGYRFIVGYPKCSLKPLLKDVTCILKLFQHQIKSFHNKNRVWTGVSNFWVIENNAPVVERIDKINKKKQAVSVRTFEFLLYILKFLAIYLEMLFLKLSIFVSRVEYHMEFM